ncbi:macrophage mannose receptor 1-like [Tachysurus fulvidraco]|uniref:macrophage mannose receptor 1-like n=1 Tax=Tachysurus fulvidraco TaxID=1234273 RepID=UPI001FEF9EC3|nr:macrophage mannose receptor 1-like [Tachysurus fulvidraco]
MSWLEAQTYCRQHHTDLASSRDATEDSVIKGLISGWTWFGLFRDSWKWTDQTNFSTIRWMTGKPDNALKNENCGYINNGQAADALCSDIMPFFCYSDIKVQQTLRVKVRSDKDVNDPAVMTAILEQINQKLKDDLGTENITVKWRKQPDGVVFHKLKEEEKYYIRPGKEAPPSRRESRRVHCPAIPGLQVPRWQVRISCRLAGILPRGMLMGPRE